MLLAGYFIQVLGGLSDTVASIRWMSPFHYYGTAITDGLDPAACLGLVLALACLALVAGIATVAYALSVRRWWRTPDLAPAGA